MSTGMPREKAVFVEAMEISDPEQRRQFFDDACRADQALRAQVEKLLALSPCFSRMCWKAISNRDASSTA